MASRANPASSIYEGTAPQLLTDDALAKGFDKEMHKYAEVINDAANPVSRVDIVVSSQAAKDFLGARLETLAQRFSTQEGLQLPYTIEVAK